MHAPTVRRFLATSMATIALFAAGCSEDPAAPQAAPADLETFFETIPEWSAFEPALPSENAPTDDEPVDELIESGGDDYDCTTTRYSLTETPDKITIFNPDAEILWLGSLLQGDGYRDGLGSLQELPIRQRAPLKIFIDLLDEDVAATVENPDAQSVATALGGLVAAAEATGHQAGSKFFFDRKITHSVEEAALDLGVSVNYLGTNVESELDYDKTVEKRTVSAYFIQQMYTASMVLPQTPEEMFSADFTQDVLDRQVQEGRIGPDNPPTYISSIVYGRMLMLTMTSSYSYERMFSALEASRSSLGGGSISNEDMEVLQEAQFRVSTVGGSDDGVTALLSTGQLSDYFAADAPLTTARPLSYTVRPLVGSDNIARVSETTEYNIRECTLVASDPVGARYRIRLDKLRHIENGCDGAFSPSPEVYYDFDLHSPAGTSDFAALPSGSAVTMSEGGELSIGASRTVDLRGSDMMRISGTAWDHDTDSADEVMGTWDLSWGWGTGDGQRYFTRGGNGCRIRLYVTITKIADLYD